MNTLSYLLLIIAFVCALLACLNFASRFSLIGAALASYFLSLLVAGARVFFVLALCFTLASCANMTSQQAKLLADVETTAVTVGVAAGSAYAADGNVDQSQLIAQGIQSTATLLPDIIAIQQSHVTAPATTSAIQDQVTAPNVVKTQVAPQVASAVASAVAQGADPKAAAAAAASGLQKAADQIVTTAKENQ